MTKSRFIMNDVVFPTDSITKCLDQIAQEQNFTEYTIELQNSCQNGDNYMGYIYSANISTNKNGNKQLNLIVKKSPFEGVVKEFTPMNELYSREICMYSEYLPNLYEIQDRFNLKSRLSNLAKLYAFSSIPDDEFLVMQDLKAEGYSLRNRQEPLDLAHCRIFMEQLGYLHALSLVFKQEKNDLFLTFANRVTDKHIFKVNDLKIMTMQNQQVNEKALKTIDPVQEPFVHDRFRMYLKTAFETLENLANPDLVDDISVIIHGDCWTNNFLWKYKNDNPERLILIDWQASRYGSPAYDISYFMYNCTDGELRDQHFDALLDHYHQSACATISRCGYDPLLLYPRQLFDKHIKTYFRYGLSMCLHTLNIFLTDVDEIPNLREVREMNEDELELWNCEKKNHFKYVKRMHDIVSHAVSRGFI